MRRRKQLFQLLLILVIAAGCKENYEPPVIQKGTTALVVDGFINNSADTTFIRLTHTNKLNDGVNHAEVLGAQMTIEDVSGNTLYNFQELNDSGVYVVPGMNLDINNKYRLRILTGIGQYLSDEIPVIKTPPVDSITFEHTGAGVAICANTHDPLNNTHYYRWEYTETYQYHAAHFSGLIFDGGLRDRLPSEYIYTCWRTQNNTQILTTSTTKLSQDIVYHNTVRFVDQDGLQLSIKYLIALRQFALTKESFEYLENLRKITEQAGSLFDAQPSQLVGNIHSLNNPNEVVLGYLTASTQETKQLYISTEDVQPWEYKPDCSIFEIPIDQANSAFVNDALVPLSIDGSPLMPKGVFATSHPCGDCRVFGGSTTKPFFFQ
jgi:hypothetical protein